MTTHHATVPAGGHAPAGPGRAESALPPNTQCGHWIGTETRYCRATEGVRHYTPGHRCSAHSPAALQCKPEPQPGPGWPIHLQEEP